MAVVKVSFPYPLPLNEFVVKSLATKTVNLLYKYKVGSVKCCNACIHAAKFGGYYTKVYSNVAHTQNVVEFGDCEHCIFSFRGLIRIRTVMTPTEMH